VSFIGRHAAWFWGLAGVVVIYALYRAFGSSDTPTAEEIASTGTLTPGVNVFADTGGALGYGVPSLSSTDLNSGANSTAPSNQGALTSFLDAIMLGTQTGQSTYSAGGYSGGSTNPDETAAGAITMPALGSLMPAATPGNSTLQASTAPGAYDPYAANAYGAPDNIGSLLPGVGSATMSNSSWTGAQQAYYNMYGTLPS